MLAPRLWPFSNVSRRSCTRAIESPNRQATPPAEGNDYHHMGVGRIFLKNIETFAVLPLKFTYFSLRNQAMDLECLELKI